MKPLRWDAKKSEWLKLTRGLSFEEITEAKLLSIKENPSRPHQQLLLYEHSGYIWLVPFVEEEGGLFLKTAYRSRKYTRKVRRGEI